MTKDSVPVPPSNDSLEKHNTSHHEALDSRTDEEHGVK